MNQYEKPIFYFFIILELNLQILNNKIQNILYLN
jgi:hypothetical protein